MLTRPTLLAPGVPMALPLSAATERPAAAGGMIRGPTPSSNRAGNPRCIPCRVLAENGAHRPVPKILLRNVAEDQHPPAPGLRVRAMTAMIPQTAIRTKGGSVMEPC